MPASKRPKPLYQRGSYKLIRREGRTNLEIVWYDPTRGRERSVSAGTADESAGRDELDRLFVEHTGGEAFCPTCGQPRSNAGVLVLTAIADYLALNSATDKIRAARPRLNHVVSYIAAKGHTEARCKDIDQHWIEGFRKWAILQPIVSPNGKTRPRTQSTVENSVMQLQAAINRCGGVDAQFKAMQPREVNRTPTYRADVPTLIRMFRYCLYPEAKPGETLSEKNRTRRVRERQHLLNFLRISVATYARPDAAHDVSTAPERKQWHSEHRVLNLNPAGRWQTRKYRATVPVARRMADILDDTDGLLIPVNSVENAWCSMEEALGLPRQGESGMKLIRRSMAHIARSRLPEEAWGEIEYMLGHARFDSTSDVYAPFSPTYLRRVLAVTESVIDEIEAGCRGAFYRTFTATGGKVVALGVAKNG